MTSDYSPEITAVLCIDLYHDFLSEGGRLNPAIKQIADEVGLLDNLRSIVSAARDAGLAIFHVPHRRFVPGQFSGWKYLSPSQRAAEQQQYFAAGSWGGSFHDDFQPQPDDVVVTEHWGPSGFPNTNLEHQLRRRGKEKLILVGLLANTCVEATARIGMELGFHVTLVTDATAARSAQAMQAAHLINGPTYAHQILSTADLVAALGGVREGGPAG